MENKETGKTSHHDQNIYKVEQSLQSTFSQIQRHKQPVAGTLLIQSPIGDHLHMEERRSSPLPRT